MAQWQVIASKVEILPHPNADGLELAKVGPFQLVVAKSNGYKTGDIVVFAPERSILPEDLRANYSNPETNVSYLRGADHSIVARIRLRGEFSEGVTINHEYVESKLGIKISEIPLDEVFQNY